MRDKWNQSTSKAWIIFIAAAGFVISGSFASAKSCEGYGPQAPRDISQNEGASSVVFSPAPPPEQLNLCNIHFHKNAEHKGPEFSESAGKGDYGGFKCEGTDKLDKSQLANSKITGCEKLKAGDTVEVHWVYSSCDVKPGEGLSACLSEACPNPQLRVETQVFLTVNDQEATDFTSFAYGKEVEGYHQPKRLPEARNAVQYLGSTTGPSYSGVTCSPMQATWNVRKGCKTLNVNTLHKWCQKNVFAEKTAHGVRQLITNKELLSQIK